MAAITDFNLTVASFIISDNGTTLSTKGSMVDGASAIGVQIGSTTSYSTPGAKLLSIVNNVIEKAYFDLAGKLYAPALASATAAQLPLTSSVADAGVAVKIAASVDLTSGKILTLGDNDGTSYAEKAWLDFAGKWFAVGVASSTAATIGVTSSVADAGTAVKIAASTDLTSGKIVTFGDNDGTSYAEKAWLDFAGKAFVPALLSSTAATLPVTSSVADGGTAVKIAASVDLTSGKILTLGDNDGTSYAEKAYVDKDGYYITAGDIGTKLYSQPLWRCLIVAAAGTPKDNTDSPSSTYTLTAGQVVMLQSDVATWVEIVASASMTLLGAKSVLLEANEKWFYVVKSGAEKISVDCAAGSTNTKLFTMES